MKKHFYIVAGVSLASVIGLSGVALGDKKGDPEMGGNTWVQMAQAKDFNTTRSNSIPGVKKSGDDGNKDDIPKGSGNPMKGLTGGKETWGKSWAERRFGYVPVRPGEVRSGGKWP